MASDPPPFSPENATMQRIANALSRAEMACGRIESGQRRHEALRREVKTIIAELDGMIAAGSDG